MSNGRVREYIGARYVPIFADPVQWDIDNTYDPLTMVQNAGETYMTKQYVPAGIELPTVSTGQESNDYWVHMSNWNAQVEAYREEVVAYAAEVLEYNGRITAVETGLPIADYDSEHTVTDAINAGDTAINAIIGTGFDSTNTVAKAISDEENAREAQDSIRPICFANVAAMKSSTDITNGMVCRTMGFRVENDGGGAWYKIVDSGTANEMDVIACGDLFAELIIENFEYNPQNFGAYCNGTNDDAPYIQRCINKALADCVNNSVNNAKVIGGNFYIETKITITAPSQDIRLDIDFNQIKANINDYALELKGHIDGWNINVNYFTNTNGGCINLTSINANDDWMEYTNISGDYFGAKNDSSYDCIHCEADKTSQNPGFVNEINIRVNRFVSGRWAVYGSNCHCFVLDHCGFEYAGLYMNACDNWTLLGCRTVENPSSAYLIQTVGFCESLLILNGENIGIARYDEAGSKFNFSSQTFGVLISHQESVNVYDYSGTNVFNIVNGKLIRQEVWKYYGFNGTLVDCDTTGLSVLEKPNIIQVSSNTNENLYLDRNYYGGYGKINDIMIGVNNATINIYAKVSANETHLMKTITSGSYGWYRLIWMYGGRWAIMPWDNVELLVDYN